MPEVTQVDAKVVADSVNETGDRLTTMVVTLPRSALAELNTHRAFSRNSASSRAVPVERMIEYVQRSPYVPRAFSVNKPGMNAHEFIEPGSPQWTDVLAWWTQSVEIAVRQARAGLELGVHKQEVNRILEPYLMHTVVISGTEWNNFFEQRLATDDTGAPLAYLPIYDAAVAMRDALTGSAPRTVASGEWHTPFITPAERDVLAPDQVRAVAAARSARVSYFTPTGDRVVGAGPSLEADLRLCERLLDPGEGSAPHLSPFEHVATPAAPGSGNFTGWRQWRADVEAKRGALSPSPLRR
ncbi:hypothetical protein [Pseudonocardia sp. GCM10023141]|uniref:hypothetical protein n=1 Tax=Pseudonocardia sp. GCM10023141 TaxID=3252653 RepID=UPI00360BD053